MTSRHCKEHEIDHYRSFPLDFGGISTFINYINRLPHPPPLHQNLGQQGRNLVENNNSPTPIQNVFVHKTMGWGMNTSNGEFVF